MRILRSLAFALGAMAFSSNATIIDYDDTIDNSFYDTETELAWIDFGQTNNMTFSDVLAELGAGGAFFGWRLPRVDEVIAMSFNLVYSGTTAPDFVEENDEFRGEGTIDAFSANSDIENGDDSVWEAVFEAIGYNVYNEWSGFNTFTSQGLYETENGISAVFIRDFVDLANDGTVVNDLMTLDGRIIASGFLSFGNADMSTLLVRNTAEISAPTSIALFSLGLVALIRLRKAK
ncbi:hypothetical protein [Glaciecola sp. KUL10]|uniref:hypothetical protein n=1 Tax=Glaciecola sp. (strain KUL10) TaxID=2161813 RepID=UPI000D785435|nr:hypothetical protein [Glaciecola sp. KUL10]GBL04957.1 hypothetical protein KUL10_22750 [Glaciecola sp. KUL10]